MPKTPEDYRAEAEILNDWVDEDPDTARELADERSEQLRSDDQIQEKGREIIKAAEKAADEDIRASLEGNDWHSTK